MIEKQKIIKLIMFIVILCVSLVFVSGIIINGIESGSDKYSSINKSKLIQEHDAVDVDSSLITYSVADRNHIQPTREIKRQMELNDVETYQELINKQVVK